MELVIGGVGFLVMIGLVLFTVLRIRPDTFRFKATLTKWVTLDLEMQSRLNSDTRQQD